MSETTVFRSEVECLRAENERLTARVAELEAKPMVEKKRKPDSVPMQWTILYLNDQESPSGVCLLTGCAAVIVYAAIAMVSFVGWARIPMTDGIEQRGVIVFSILALVWCLAFVRRVPR